MKDTPKKRLVYMINQLCDQGMLDLTADMYRTPKLNDASWQVMRGQRKVRILKPPEDSLREKDGGRGTLRDVDDGLFEELRTLRRRLAEGRSVAPFVIMHDSTLRELALRRPRTEAELRGVQGVGEKKLQDFGRRILDCIHAYCIRNPSASAPRMNESLKRAFELFDTGASVEDVMNALGRARSTTHGYLAKYVEFKRPESIRHWVDDATYERVKVAASAVGDGRLKPIFEHLGEAVPYDLIRLIVAHVALTEASANARPALPLDS